MAAMPRSLTPLLLLVALSAATVPAALAIRPAGGEAIAKACDGTATIKQCVEVLKANPDGEPPRRLAELAYSYLVTDGEALYKETQAAVAALATLPEDVRPTAESLNASMKFYYDSVVRFVPEESKKRFDEAKGNLDELLGMPSSLSAIDCPPALPVCEKVQRYEDLQAATQSLMAAADAPPKKEEPAKSVKAPAA